VASCASGRTFVKGFAGGEHALCLRAEFGNGIWVAEQVEAGTGAGKVLCGGIGCCNDDAVLVFEIRAQDGRIRVHVGDRGEKPGVNKTKPKAGKKREDDWKVALEEIRLMG
jgi:hypothetical protein